MCVRSGPSSQTDRSEKGCALFQSSQTIYLTVWKQSAHRPPTHCDGSHNRLRRAFLAVCDCPICTSATVSRANTESEYKVMANATAELIWVKALLRKLRVSLKATTCLWSDNLGATYVCKFSPSYAHKKHVKIDFYFLRESCKQNA